MVSSIDTNTSFVPTYNDQDSGDYLYRSPWLPADFVPLTDRDHGSPPPRSTTTAAQPFNHPATDAADDPFTSSDPNIECAKPEPSTSSADFPSSTYERIPSYIPAAAANSHAHTHGSHERIPSYVPAAAANSHAHTHGSQGRIPSYFPSAAAVSHAHAHGLQGRIPSYFPSSAAVSHSHTHGSHHPQHTRPSHPHMPMEWWPEPEAVAEHEWVDNEKPEQ